MTKSVGTWCISTPLSLQCWFSILLWLCVYLLVQETSDAMWNEEGETNVTHG